MEDLKKFAQYFRKYKAQLILGIACILASVIAGLLIPRIVGQAVDANWTQVSWSKLTISAGKVLAASLVSGLFLFLQRRILIGMSRNIEYDMRKVFYRHLVDQPLDRYLAWIEHLVPIPGRLRPARKLHGFGALPRGRPG